MDKERRRAAKGRLVAGMVRGLPWEEALADAGIRASRSTAYRWVGAARTRPASPPPWTTLSRALMADALA